MKRGMRALSIRQPYAELILRGIKTIEYRTLPTRIIGERFHIYAPLKPAPADSNVWSRDLAMPAPPYALPEWMIELAEQVGMIEPGALLPTGVIVGSAVIQGVSRIEPRSAGSGRAFYRWHLGGVERAKTLRKPTGRPQPVWFKPF
jgi:hypothetical protein